MKWKELLIAAIITLVVTLISGILVWKLTQGAKPEPKEQIIYELDSPANFKSESKSLVFNTLRIGNLGNKPAQGILLSIEFPENTEIVDFSIHNSSGNSAKDNQQLIASKSNEKLIAINSLIPNEVLTISILTNEYDQNLLKVSARYNDGLAERGSLAKSIAATHSETESKKHSPLSLFLIGLIFFLIFRTLSRLTGGTRSINNSAFVMLHQGLVSEATMMLEDDIKRRGSTSFELANLGLCKALSGDVESSERLFNAAELYSPSKYIKALVAFNRAILNFQLNDKDKAVQYFEEAINHSARDVKKYLSYSIYAQEMVRRCPSLSKYTPMKV